MNILREVREKIAAGTDAMSIGQASDYPGYRELVGRVKVLRELEDWILEQVEKEKLLSEGDTIQ